TRYLAGDEQPIAMMLTVHPCFGETAELCFSRWGIVQGKFIRIALGNRHNSQAQRMLHQIRSEEQ
ncbi:MAG: hypothetical protein M3Q64_00480, partial [bacterium]|nr:hypothetical protein [bacterium]